MNWTNENCSSPHPIPSLLHVNIEPTGPVIMDNGSKLMLICNHTDLEPTIFLNISWEFNGTTLASDKNTHSIIVTSETEGEYRCIVQVSFDSEETTALIANISDSVLVELPSELLFV